MNNKNTGNNNIIKLIVAAIILVVIIGCIVLVKNMFGGNGDFIATDADNNTTVNVGAADTTGITDNADIIDEDESAVVDTAANDDIADTNDATESPADESDADNSAADDNSEDNTVPEQGEPVHDPKVDEADTAGQDQVAQEPETVTYRFRNKNLLDQHYEKHGIEMGFDSAASYEAAASAVINNPAALSKTEAEDGDYVYYVEATNEFVILSTDGYIRTYFLPSGGKAYYDRQ